MPRLAGPVTWISRVVMGRREGFQVLSRSSDDATTPTIDNLSRYKSAPFSVIEENNPRVVVTADPPSISMSTARHSSFRVGSRAPAP